MGGISIKDFKTLCKLGEGASGSVDQILMESTGMIYAIKIINYISS